MKWRFQKLTHDHNHDFNTASTRKQKKKLSIVE